MGRFTFRPPAVLRLRPSSIYPGLVTQTGHYQGDQEQDNADHIQDNAEHNYRGDQEQDNISKMIYPR